MTFNDILKKSFLEGMSAQEMSAETIFFIMLVTCGISLYIFAVYKVVTRKTFYSKSFNISLAVLGVLTASIIVTIQTSVVVSLGMVGALSIVRFRTAVKDPMDLVFLFWSISVGIICGAGLFQVAIITSLVVTIFIVILELFPVAQSPMILVVNSGDYKAEEALVKKVREYCRFYKIKSRNITGGNLDIIFEVRIKRERELIQAVNEIPSVVSVSLLGHDGEITY